MVLRSHQGYLGITKEDLLCVSIAGLCHDLGHGPFSHVWDGSFMRRAGGANRGWTHEQGSVFMLRHLLADNHINLQRWGLTDTDMVSQRAMLCVFSNWRRTSLVLRRAGARAAVSTRHSH
jgi:HD superfamily phosphohydrolase